MFCFYISYFRAYTYQKLYKKISSKKLHDSKLIEKMQQQQNQIDATKLHKYNKKKFGVFSQ